MSRQQGRNKPLEDHPSHSVTRPGPIGQDSNPTRDVRSTFCGGQILELGDAAWVARGHGKGTRADGKKEARENMGEDMGEGSLQ